MADHIRVFEETEKKSVPVWAWLVPLLLVLLLAFGIANRRAAHVAGREEASKAVSPAILKTDEVLPHLGTVRFAPNSDTLTADGKNTLDQAAAVMKGNARIRIRLEGYTDSLGSHARNLTLSQQRVIAAATYLKENGVDWTRLTGEGFAHGDTGAATSTTAGDTADTRRVELYSQR